MKTNIQYICEKCGTIYTEPAEARDCEDFHLDQEYLTIDRTKGYSSKTQLIPREIVVRFTDHEGQLWEQWYSMNDRSWKVS